MKRAKIMTTNESWSTQDNRHQAADVPFTRGAAPGQSQDAQAHDAQAHDAQAQNAQAQDSPSAGYQPAAGQFGNQGYRYQGTPTPTGYQDNPGQFPPGYGPNGFPPYAAYRTGGIGRASQQLSGTLAPGNLGMLITGAIFGFGPLGGWRGRFRFLWYIRIALFLIFLGAILYVGFT